ncbi:unnamed protein product [Angiostrongylus costaricensis]|uniref:Coiled-coil domain containing 146 n=1 Tax=Angiostrongylus costaricensis TaxID=334426 RepID=A0A0R3PHI6_ANGCS|nr:unnamed protein product [Angiostrongylus costaricensis]
MQELTELRILINRIEELEVANRKLTLQMRRMKKQLSEKERTSQQEAIALRGLEIMKRNQLLEHSVRNVERTMLCNFFEAVEPKPTQEVSVYLLVLFKIVQTRQG